MATIVKGKNGYNVRVSYYDDFGKRHFLRKSGFRTKMEAQLYAQQQEVRKLSGENIAQSDISFYNYMLSWYETYKKESVAPATRRNYEYTLNQVDLYFQRMPIVKVTKSRYQQFLNHLAKQFARETVAKIAGHCRSCVEYAVDDDILRKNFTKHTKIPLTKSDDADAAINFLNVSDMTKLKEYILPKAGINNVGALMVLFGLLTGARYSEVAGMTWDCIDYKHLTITINKTLDYKDDYGFLPTKTQASKRTITITKELATALDRFHRDQISLKITDMHHLMFLGKNGKVPSNSAVNQLLTRIHNKIGIRRITFHGLRHTHASYLIYKDVSIYVISHRLGHSDVGITQRVYAHVILELEQTQQEKINDVLEQF
ncbi:tyrosine-type recombinase/integrase [Lactiplantibacillus plajomi]|uniref:Tyrosine-type recombinase/integrase n=1 Tax=Lactiplantibacillus plajomi TaxID=1457217 RepID=A0ABV6K1Y1_9LACO|nr:site-specific integrase [Lactiplantibacillus plajomi]